MDGWRPDGGDVNDPQSEPVLARDRMLLDDLLRHQSAEQPVGCRLIVFISRANWLTPARDVPA